MKRKLIAMLLIVAALLTMLPVTALADDSALEEPDGAAAETTDQASGWVKKDGHWLYYDQEDNWYVSDIVYEINGSYYCFDQNGWMQKGWYKCSLDGLWYYAGSNGACLTGWQKINSKWYYFECDEEYDVWPSMLQNETRRIDDKTYFFESNGSLCRTAGWHKIVTTYGDKTDTRWCYTDAKGVCVSGWKTIDGKKYYFDDINYCLMAIGPTYAFGDGGTGIFFFDAHGQVVTSDGWHSVTTYSYDLDRVAKVWGYIENGELVSGWKKINGKWYYFDPEMTVGNSYTYNEKTDTEAVYYFESNGAMTTTAGWHKTVMGYGDYVYNVWCYTNSSGVCRTGWVKMNGNWYWFDYDGTMANSTTRIDGKYYDFNVHGVCQNPSSPRSSY